MLPKDVIDPAQMPPTFRLQPVQNFVINSKRDLSLQGPIVYSDACASQETRGHLRSVSVVIERSVPFPIQLLRRFADLDLLHVQVGWNPQTACNREHAGQLWHSLRAVPNEFQMKLASAKRLR